jgi:zinc/manganese transport system substrate-binding protein
MEGKMRILAGLMLVLGVAFGVSGAAAAEPKRVVATFSILGDLTAQIGGDKVRVETLIKADQDAHGFEPRPSDVRSLTQAQLVVANGLDFETWLDKAMKASGAKAAVAVATAGIKPREGQEDGHDDTHGHTHKGHDHGPADPHAWQDVKLVKTYANNIAEALAKIDPANAAYFRARAAFYASDLDRLDAEIKALIAPIPSPRRVVVTNHDAFGYFGAAYGVRFLSPIGVSTEAEPSAADVAALIRQIRKDKITAVFVENMDDPRLIEQIARETAAKVGPKIYSDALSGPTGPAATYLQMMRHNARAFAAAMK